MAYALRLGLELMPIQVKRIQIDPLCIYKEGVLDAPGQVLGYLIGHVLLSTPESHNLLFL